MCQIIALETTVKKFKKIMSIDIYPSLLNGILEEKGGDYFSAIAITEQKQIFKNSDLLNIINPLNYILKKIDSEKLLDNERLNILLFSRQQPEMESENVEEQPYTHKKINDLIFAVHGTIHNDNELAKEKKVNIKADTEILQYLDPSEFEKAEGTFCVIGITGTRFTQIYEHGLKLWRNTILENNEHLADIISTTNLDFFNKPTIPLTRNLNNTRTLFVSFSGGMDIALSTYYQLKVGESINCCNAGYDKLILNYFAWGSIAEFNEMASLEKFKDFYSSEFNIPVEINTIYSEDYFEEYFDLTDSPHPKISKNNSFYTGEKEEAESPLTYVPYRNTQFAIMLAGYAESHNLKNIDILFGLNLSEGMVFMDNSDGWLDAINQVVKFGGKDFKLSGTYNVISPYFTRTKTNMLKEFSRNYSVATLEQLLLLSKSCYYPKVDGAPCGKCGSCLLRQKAIESIELLKN